MIRNTPFTGLFGEYADPEESPMQQETDAEPESYVRDATPEEEAEMIRNTPFTGLFGDQ